jgi:1,4-dihydroxy-6-naphthoate synthase
VTKAIRLAFSPDSDDIFMFWPLLRGKIPTLGYTFTAERADTETLNARAERGDVDVIAVSIAHYGRVSDKYALLPHGASVGRGYGPVVVTRTPRTLDDVKGKRIAIPGERTTAYAVLRILLPEFEAITVPISPYRKVFEALEAGTVDAALLIHEGRLTYEREGTFRVIDIGEEWHKLTGLPIPLGGNVIAKSLGPEGVREVSALCRASIAWALANRDEVVDGLLKEETRTDLALTRAMLDRYLDMYANEDTRDLPEDAREGVRVLLHKMYEAGLLKSPATVEFAL